MPLRNRDISGTWIRIEEREETDGVPTEAAADTGEWILIDDPQDPEQTAFSRMNAGAYQVYWYYGEEAPTLTEDGQYAGEVEIAKADLIGNSSDLLAPYG